MSEVMEQVRPVSDVNDFDEFLGKENAYMRLSQLANLRGCPFSQGMLRWYLREERSGFSEIVSRPGFGTRLFVNSAKLRRWMETDGHPHRGRQDGKNPESV